MIQKKVCMVGVFATGKTSLVHRFVHSLFSAKYHSTVGVKIDRKQVQVGTEQVSLLLWDIEGRTPEQEIPESYLKCAHAVLYVADCTRRETVDQLYSLRDHVRSAAGEVPSVVALNKHDLTDQWTVTPADTAKLITGGFHALTTSAKSCEGVEDAFRWIATATLNAPPTPTVQPPVRHGN
ncbi:MAG: GTP-binding protein [Gemmatimonadetes bacterium]|nr:GTP-binding protein [Gemmatimonadota bacterium]